MNPACVLRACFFASCLLVTTAPGAAAPVAPWEQLFDGQTLHGWKAAEHPGSVSVADGLIMCSGPRAHLFYVGPDGHAEFENFELEADVRTTPGANSGIYFHATWQDEGWPRLSGFEVQVNNNQPAFEKNYIENKKTGSLYGVRNVYKAMVADGEWFTMNIVVRRPRVEVRLNGRPVMEYTEPNNPPVLNAGTTMDLLSKGTFALQCHDEKSQVFYRNIRVRRLPPGEDPAVAKPTYNAQDLQRAELGKENFPLVDLRVHPDGGPSLAQLQALRASTGLFAGFAYRLGHEPEAGDEAAARAVAGLMKDQPVFVGLELPGTRGIGPTPSPETLALFDYVIAATPAGGPSVEPPDKTAKAGESVLMDALVDEVVARMEQQPIDVYGNVMVLSQGLHSAPETLWTEDRMRRVIVAAVKHGVALEINPRERTPSEKFIRLARESGAKFTIGGDGTTAANFADWSYVLEMQRKVGLAWRDLWVPGHGPTRAQRALLKN